MASAIDPPFDRRAIPADAVESRWQAADGWSIRRIDWSPPAGTAKGSILFLPGRGDFYEKYLETLAHWHRLGWNVSASDWRGQGDSGRLGTDQVTGHIDDFGTWTADLGQLWASWKAATPGPHLLAAHSMGGHLVLRATAERLVDPAALILSAPMLGFSASLLPEGAMHQAAKLMKALGDPRRPAWKWSEAPGEVPETRAKLLTHDAARYADELWWRDQRRELVMGPGSWGWVERAYASMRYLARAEVLAQVKVPVLIVATDSDRLVGWKAIARAAQHLPDCELVHFGSEAHHEVLREGDPVRRRALAACDAMLARVAASGAP